MKIIKRKSDNVVLFQGEDLVLNEDGCGGDGWKFRRTPLDDLVLETVEDIPDNVDMGLWTHVSDVWIRTATGDAIDNKQLAEYVNNALIEVDLAADVLVNAVIGGRTVEYLTAESQAQTYIDAGYTGSVQPYVDGWAQAKLATQKWAADSIIETAISWRASQADLRAKRLRAKESIRNAISNLSIDEIVRQWHKDVDIIKQHLGV